jgi:hypothetical protein
MSLTTYSGLKSSIAAWTHRGEISSAVVGGLDDFIDLAEARLNRVLRVSQQETQVTAAASALYVALPAEFLAIRTIALVSSPIRELQYISPAEMDILADNGTVLNYYTVLADQIRLQATSTSSLNITYYSKIAALSDSNTSNWVLSAYPEAYLYGALAEAFRYYMDDEQSAKYAGLFAEVVDQIKHLDDDRKYGQSMSVRVA